VAGRTGQVELADPPVVDAVLDAVDRRAGDRPTSGRSPPAPTRHAYRALSLRLAVVVLLALGLRIGVLLAVDEEPVGGDGWAYMVTSHHLARGEGYVDPVAAELPGAHHPPGWITVLAVPQLLGVETQLGLQVFAAFVGAGTVLLIGLAARQIAGERAGLTAAVLAAVYPGFWKYERELLSETLVFAVLALVLLLAYRYLERSSRGRAVALGAALGATVLIRAELVLLLPLLAVPLVLRNGRPFREQAVQLGLLGWVVVAAVAPWTAYNLGRFEEPVVLTTGLGAAMAIANCDEAYHGELMGHFDRDCAIRHSLRAPDNDRSEQDLFLRAAAVDYMGDHLGRLPVVELARAGRTWSLYRPGQQINLDQAWTRTPARILWAQLLTYWAIAVGAILGAIVLRRRGIVLWPLLAPVFSVLAMGLVITGQPRYRSPAEVSLVILAAVAVDEVVRRIILARTVIILDPMVPDATSRR
jgi:4-amino-4-deoxy-L-arabinose transferase-like glycosyltransferase